MRSQAYTSMAIVYVFVLLLNTKRAGELSLIIHITYFANSLQRTTTQRGKAVHSVFTVPVKVKALCTCCAF